MIGSAAVLVDAEDGDVDLLEGEGLLLALLGVLRQAVEHLVGDLPHLPLLPPPPCTNSIRPSSPRTRAHESGPIAAIE